MPPYLAVTMKILVIGGGGREHALIWKLRQSPLADKIWCAPGNGGISADVECIDSRTDDVPSLLAIADKLRPHLTVVGPELPLTHGLADELARRNLPVVGPCQLAAELEASKAFAKQFMERHNIPTAAPYGVYDNELDAYTALCSVDWPLVIKADGLAAGKGVLVTSSPDSATAFIERVMERREFGDAGRRIIFEEGLAGEEISYIVLTDGEHMAPIAPARDYKRVRDDDASPNTGGMGAFSSEGWLPPEMEERILREIVRPTIAGLAEEGRPYRGFLYFGIMLTAEGPKVLEFNVRLGDPETQALVMRMDFDFADVLAQTAAGKLDPRSLHWRAGASACVVMAAEGYPSAPRTGDRIEGLEEAAAQHGITIFHSGTRREGNGYYTAGGRVLAIACADSSLESAVARCYDAVRRISFPGAHYRTDIGKAGRPEMLDVARG
jgi:phosphoribosylamine--glycine ligase